MAPLTMSRCRHFHSSLLPLLHPFFDRDFETTLSLILPDDVWREVLEYVDPDEYSVLARRVGGVSREFYWLLKNSLTTIRVHRPVVPLCGVVWLHSRDTHFSCIKCVEVAFPASGVDLKALFRFLGQARRHPVRVAILPNHKWFTPNGMQYTRDWLSTELALIDVEGFAVEELQPCWW